MPGIKKTLQTGYKEVWIVLDDPKMTHVTGIYKQGNSQYDGVFRLPGMLVVVNILTNVS